MVSAKEWTDTDPKDYEIIVLTTRLYKLDKRKILSSKQFKEEEVTEPTPAPKTIGRDTNKSYVEEINSIESWRVN